MKDFEWYAESFLKVRDKQTPKLVPLELRPAQRRLIRWMLEQYQSGKPVRVIILKARQEGVSTVVQAFFFWLWARPGSCTPSRSGTSSSSRPGRTIRLGCYGRCGRRTVAGW
jgi:hypothetical protein